LRACILPIFRATPATQKTDGELPAEYVSSSLAQQSQVWCSFAHVVWQFLYIFCALQPKTSIKKNQNMQNITLIEFCLLGYDAMSSIEIQLCSGGWCHLPLEGRRISWARNQHESMWQAGWFLARLIFYPEDFFLNFAWLSADYTVSYPRR
jgi:hypothetical protein